jgi:hypothetical protein
MARKMTFGTVLLALMLILSSASFASLIQVNFGGPPTSGTVSISTAAVTFGSITGWANQSSSLGSYSITAGGVVVTGSTGGYYTLASTPVGLDVTLGSETMTGTMVLNGYVKAGPWTDFDGTYYVSSATPGFASTGFPANSHEDISFSVYRGGVITQGSIQPDPAVPEPGTIGLIGSGLLVAAGMLRRKLR